MSRLLCGAALGVVVGYMIRKMQEEKKLDQIANDINKFASQAKKKVKNFMDEGQNEAEYIAERAEYAMEKGKDKVAEIQKEVSNQQGTTPKNR